MSVIEFVKTDDLQYCAPIGDRSFMMIQAVEGMDDEELVVYSGLVNLNDYSEEEKSGIVDTYYRSYKEFLNFNEGCSKEEIDKLIAEMIFETELLDQTEHGVFKSETEAIGFMEQWMEEHSIEKECDDLER